MQFDYNDPIITKRRKGTSDDPFIDCNETHVVENGKVILTEIPDPFTRVIVTGANKQWVEIQSGIPKDNEYLVDYKNKVVTFNTTNNGLQLNFSYKGTGLIYVPTSMIYTKQNNGEIVETLKQLTDSTEQARDTANEAADSLVHLGEYDNATQYKKRNIVTYQGSTYMAIADTQGNLPTDENYWKKLTAFSWKGIYDSAVTYNTGDFVQDIDQRNLYLSLIDSNTGNDLTDTTKWKKLITIDDIVNTANQVIANANTATTNANNAANNANTEATNAQNQANYAKTQGDYAKGQGDYAKAQGDAANLAASNANDAATNANNAATNATNAANEAITQATYAQTQGDYAKSQGDYAANEASNLSQLKTDVTNATQLANDAANNANNAAINANNAADNANTQATYAQQQGDYAKAQGDVANLATNNANNAATAANEATNNANIAANNANTQATNAQNAAQLANEAAMNANNAADNANTQATYAQTQGDYARQQGDYALAKGDYANEKAILADQAATNANTEATNLSQLKADVTIATQNANNAATTANDAANNATSQANYAKSQGDYAKEQGDYAKAQGDYAKSQGDYAHTQGLLIDNLKTLGEYDPSVTYEKNNIVRYNGSSYIAKQTTVGNPPTDTTYWELLAQRGVDGQGSVSSVNNIYPDTKGNIILTATDIGASPSDHTHPELHTHNNKTVLDGLSDDEGKLLYNGTPVGSVTSVNGQTGDVTGLETVTGAQEKANIAEINAKTYADQQIGNLNDLATTDQSNIVNAINENTNKIEDLSKSPNEYEWIATAGQVTYILPESTQYDPNSKWLEVTVGGAPVPPSLIQKDNPTQFTLLVDPLKIPDGVKVVARWFETYIPATAGHNSTHYETGTDPIDITKLKNYKSAIDDRIGNLSSLNTTAKSSLVSAVNEVKQQQNAHLSDTTMHVTQAEKDAWNAKIDASEKGVPNGIATLDENGKIPISQLNNISTGSAIDVSITDNGGYYTSSDVEGALQEIGQTLNAMRGDLITSVNNVLNM